MIPRQTKGRLRPTTNLNQEVRDGKIDPLIGRDFEVQRVIQHSRGGARTIRCWSAKRASVRLPLPRAWRLIEQKQVPEVIEQAVVYSLNLGVGGHRTE